MTITFQGHVECVEVSREPGMIDVRIQTAQAECGQVVVLRVPTASAVYWLVGRQVQFTVYALKEPT